MTRKNDAETIIPWTRPILSEDLSDRIAELSIDISPPFTRRRDEPDSRVRRRSRLRKHLKRR